MPILTPEERLGTTVAGKYHLDRILGAGGMGVVFAAHHQWTNRKVALKLLRHEAAENADVVRRFLREAKAAAKLRHPSVVDVLDMGQDDDGGVYLVLELLEGEALSAELERESKIDAARALLVTLPILDALAEAHEKGIVHRDLKPDNIFCHRAPGGELLPKVLDFGIAKVLESAKTLDTQTGTVLGTPYYMSPEQASGTDEVGPPADVWSMGVVLYESLTGERPFDGPSATAILLKIMTGDVPSLAAVEGVPPSIARTIDRALVRDPKQRYDDMGAFAQALRAAAAEASLEAPRRVTLSELKTLAVVDGEEAFATTLRSDTPPVDRPRTPKPELAEARQTGASRVAPRGRGGMAAAVAIGVLALVGAGVAWSQLGADDASPVPAASPPAPVAIPEPSEPPPPVEPARVEEPTVPEGLDVATAPELVEAEPAAPEETSAARPRRRRSAEEADPPPTAVETPPERGGAATVIRDTF